MYKIYTLFLVLLTLAAFATCAPRELNPHFPQKCQKKFNISEEELIKFSELNVNDFTFERNFKCYVKCMVDEFHDRDANGKIVLNTANRVPGGYPSDRAIINANQCYDKVELEEDDCEYSFKFIFCVDLAVKAIDQN